MAVGYLVGSHVIYSKPLAILLESMIALNKIEPSKIAVVVNGSWTEHAFMENGVRFYYRQREFVSHFAPLVNFELGEVMDCSHWFYLNCTSRCGPRFKELVESGFNSDADATLAGSRLPITSSGGTDGRAINDIAMYRYDYLMQGRDKINDMYHMGNHHAIWEGILYAHAPRQAHYPMIDYQSTGPTNIYGAGTPRITEYYPGIDWYRFKKNWGQLTDGTFEMARI